MFKVPCLIVGTVPLKDFPLVCGEVAFKDGCLWVGERKISATQGTGAMLGAAFVAAEYLGVEAPWAVLAGDIGKGDGSRLIYEYLTKELHNLSPKVLALHYILPIMALTRKVVEAAEKLKERPLLVADAGGMYAAKAGGLARKFDIFTPDAGEMAFLADPQAIHPAYIKRFLFESDIEKVPELSHQAYSKGNAAHVLLVKGAKDYIIKDGEVVTVVEEPNLPEMEAVGGTGDTITGLVTSLISAGFSLTEASVIAAKTNRMAAKMANLSVGTKIGEVIPKFPEVFKKFLSEWTTESYRTCSSKANLTNSF